MEIVYNAGLGGVAMEWQMLMHRTRSDESFDDQERDKASQKGKRAIDKGQLSLRM